jgi:hypothetical protein
MNLVKTQHQDRRPTEKAVENSVPEYHDLRKNLFKAILLAALIVMMLAFVRFSPIAEYLKMSNIEILQHNLVRLQ